MKKGFTLVELLAVIVILAFISLIAIPQVLHLIEKSRISSLEISASEYIRAVETSLINEEINRNVPNGLYTIVDNGKAIELNGKKIQVETSGNRIESGKLLIENKKVVRIIKGKIKDYYARIEQEDMKIYKEIKESMLLSGREFNGIIKTLVGNDDATENTSDTIIKEIIFLPESMLPEGITKEELMSFESVPVSSDGEVIAYYNGNRNVYIYSENLIQTNTDARNMFMKFQELTNITFNLLDTSKVTTMYGMFLECSNLETLNLSSFDTLNVTDMSLMFKDTKNLKELNLTSFNTKNVKVMSYMFSNCSKLKEINFGENFNTLEVVTMENMFYGCSSINELNLSNWDTREVTRMGRMFSGCSGLKELDLTSFDTSNVMDMYAMFYDSKNLESILVSKEKWIIKDGVNIDGMFHSCKVDHVTPV